MQQTGIQSVDTYMYVCELLNVCWIVGKLANYSRNQKANVM